VGLIWSESLGIRQNRGSVENFDKLIISELGILFDDQLGLDNFGYAACFKATSACSQKAEQPKPSILLQLQYYGIASI
jgi:hypothetical protein